MAAPTLAATPYNVNSSSASTAALTSPSFTPAVGEVIVVNSVTESSIFTYSGVPTSSAGGLVFTQRVADTTSNQCAVYIWTAVVGTGQNVAMTISTTALSSAGQHSMVVERWTGAQLAATPATNPTPRTGSGAPSATITTTAANSVVSWVDGDWNAVKATPAYRSGATQDGIHQVNNIYCAYYAYQQAPTAGAQTFGMTAPTGQAWTLAGIEIQAASGGGSSFSGSVSLSGAGTLATSGKPTASTTLALSGSGGLTASGTATASGALTLTGSGSLAASGGTSSTGSLSLSGSGSLAASGKPGASTTLALSGAGSLAAVGSPQDGGTLALTGSGTLAASGTMSGGNAYSGTLTLGGSGTLTASSKITAAGALALSGSGGLALSGTSNQRGTLTLSGSGTLTYSAAIEAAGTLALTGDGTLAASGVAAGMVITPAERTTVIPAEQRLTRVAAESRVTTIPAESRVTEIR